MIIDFNRYNGGGGSGSGVTPQDVQAQIDSALTPYWDSAITESAITEAVSGKADAKILVDFDHTTQAERAAVYTELKALYDGGSGATINKNYDFYKTVNTWQGLKIDYYGFSGDTMVFGKVVSPENTDDQVVYEQVMTIDSAGNVAVVTNTVGGADLSAYYTSAQTANAISAATSGKADAANVTAGNGVPSWNSQGIVTGQVASLSATRWIYVNNDSWAVLSNNGVSKTYYIPTTPGNAGEFLVSTGGAPVWSAVTMPNMSEYYTSAQTDEKIASAASITYASAVSYTDAALSGFTPAGNSNILAAITSQREYEAISGSVKTGDLIQVYDVVINGDGNHEYGLFEATVQEIEDQGVITKEIEWERKDNADSVLWSDRYYPWMTDNDVFPIDIGRDSFLISDADADDFNGIGFDGDGKPVITHIVPQYEEGKVTGMTREDRDILGELDTLDEVVSQAILDLNDRVDEISAATQNMVISTDVRQIVKLTQSAYDQLATKDPYTFYIIINNSN